MIKHRKYSRREQLEMIELRLLETRMKFINSFNPIIKKLFMKVIRSGDLFGAMTYQKFTSKKIQKILTKQVLL